MDFVDWGFYCCRENFVFVVAAFAAAAAAAVAVAAAVVVAVVLLNCLPHFHLVSKESEA